MPDPSEPDYYRILNVHHQADPEIVEAAYHAMLARHKGTPAAERDIEAAWAVLGDPDKRAAYDARRRALVTRPASVLPSAPPSTLTPPPAGGITAKQHPSAPLANRHTVPAKCSVTGQGFDVVLLRASGPLARFRVVGFVPWPPDHVDEKPKPGMLDRLRKFVSFQPPDDQPETSGGEADPEYLEFSNFDFADHHCPMCAGETRAAHGQPYRWVMCGRCSRILCMGAATTHGGNLSVTCPWCGATLHMGGPSRSGGGRVRASSRPPQLPPSPGRPALPPAPKKRLPGG